MDAENVAHMVTKRGLGVPHLIGGHASVDCEPAAELLGDHRARVRLSWLADDAPGRTTVIIDRLHDRTAISERHDIADRDLLVPFELGLVLLVTDEDAIAETSHLGIMA